MIHVHDMGFFVLSTLLLAFTPGPDTLLIVSRTTSHGLRAGGITVLGISAGIFLHTLAASLGVSAILNTSPGLFTFVKFLGAGYLLFIGVSMVIRTSPKKTQAQGVAPEPSDRSLGLMFRQGFLTNVLNPKVALFFLAFLPQFVDREASRPALSLFFLGVVFNFIGSLWNYCTALFAEFASRFLLQDSRSTQWFQRGAGAFFVYFGIRLALAGPAMDVG